MGGGKFFEMLDRKINEASLNPIPALILRNFFELPVNEKIMFFGYRDVGRGGAPKKATENSRG